jgi:hypothetical protein
MAQRRQLVRVRRADCDGCPFPRRTQDLEMKVGFRPDINALRGLVEKEDAW